VVVAKHDGGLAAGKALSEALGSGATTTATLGAFGKPGKPFTATGTHPVDPHRLPTQCPGSRGGRC